MTRPSSSTTAWSGDTQLVVVGVEGGRRRALVEVERREHGLLAVCSRQDGERLRPTEQVVRVRALGSGAVHDKVRRPQPPDGFCTSQADQSAGTSTNDRSSTSRSMARPSFHRRDAEFHAELGQGPHPELSGARRPGGMLG